MNTPVRYAAAYKDQILTHEGTTGDFSVEITGGNVNTYNISKVAFIGSSEGLPTLTDLTTGFRINRGSTTETVVVYLANAFDTVGNYTISGKYKSSINLAPYVLTDRYQTQQFPATDVFTDFSFTFQALGTETVKGLYLVNISTAFDISFIDLRLEKADGRTFDVETIKLSQPFINGYAQINVSKAYQYFINRLTMLDSPSVAPHVYTNGGMYADLTVKCVNDGNVYDVRALRSEVDWNVTTGGASNFFITNSFATGLTSTRVKVYDDYPYLISSVYKGTAVGVVRRNGITSSSDIRKILPMDVLLLNLSSSGTNFFTAGNTFLYQQIAIDRLCTPEKPFYVRYINSLGGYNYIMFEQKQTFDETIKATIDTTKNGNVILDKTLSKTVTVGNNAASKEDLAAFKELLRSNYVHVYENGAWSPLTIKDSSVQEVTNEEMYDLEVKMLYNDVKIKTNV